MDLLAQLFAGGGTPGPADDYWYRPVGGMTAAGMRVDAEGAQKISAWFRGREILATVLAMLPLQGVSAAAGRRRVRARLRSAALRCCTTRRTGGRTRSSGACRRCFT
jgi:hypothetical protein